MRIPANFLAAGLILCPGLAHGQTTPENGYWWLQQSEPFKLAWVDGYVDGSLTVKNCVSGVLRTDGNNRQQAAQS